jgi:predicted ATPase/serine/threonine protein kinase
MARQIGDYTLVRELGRGGMGRVHLAWQQSLGREVAVKEVGGLAGSRDAAVRFVREAQVAGSLSHPNIVTVHEYFEFDGVAYIAMEYAAGGSLRPYLAELELAAFAFVMEGILAGLAHAQTAGVVHRDLKPENVMVTRDGAVKIGDFGLAKAGEMAGGESFQTGSGAIIGTPRYMAPEQILSQAVSIRADLYSLGVIAYEQLVGWLPFDGLDSPTAILMCQLNEEIPPATDVRPGIDPELSRWLDQLLVKDPGRRIGDPSEAWEQLEEIVLDLLGARWRRTGRLNARSLEDQPPSTAAGTSVHSIVTGSTPVARPLPGPPLTDSDHSRKLDSVRRAAVTAGRANLPAQPTSFVGREHELNDLRVLTAEARILTLAGSGGVGKTRLAVRLGSELLDELADGVWFVDLAPITDPELVGATVAAVLRAAEQPGRSTVETIAAAISDRQLLVILDNCEQILEPAAQLAAELIDACPRLSVIATSRVPLHLAGEQVYRVPTLTTPEETDAPESIRRSAAVRLFVDRARHQRPDFEISHADAQLLARICRRLDGIPLAIELAAVRLRSLSLSELDARLDHQLRLLKSADRRTLPRQRTLHALIDWSFQLLAPAEQRALARMSVFAASGFDLTAAEVVCGGMPPDIDPEVFDLVDSLVDKSLLQVHDHAGRSRYRLLETVRDYAGDHLGEDPDTQAATLIGHRNYYAWFAEASWHLRNGPEAPAAWTALEADHDNFRLALGHCLDDPDPRPGLRLCQYLGPFWSDRGHAREALTMFARHLDRAESQRPLVERGYVLEARSVVAYDHMADLAASETAAREALEIGRACEDTPLIVRAGSTLAAALQRTGRHDAAVSLIDEMVQLAESAPDHGYLLPSALNIRALIQSYSDEDPRGTLERVLALAQEHGDVFYMRMALHNLCDSELRWGSTEKARAYGEQALELTERIGSPYGEMWSLLNLGLVYCRNRDLRRARGLFTRALTIAGQAGSPLAIAGSVLGIALTTLDPETAGTLHGLAAALADDTWSDFGAVENELREAHEAQLRAELGDDRYNLVVQAGRRLSHHDALDIAGDDGDSRRSGTGDADATIV